MAVSHLSLSLSLSPLHSIPISPPSYVSPVAFDGLGDVLMPSMTPQAGAASSPVKPMGGDLDATMASMASSKSLSRRRTVTSNWPEAFQHHGAAHLCIDMNLHGSYIPLLGTLSLEWRYIMLHSTYKCDKILNRHYSVTGKY